MEKVFERNGITLYHGDCMDLLRSTPEAAYSLAIVDPPYGNAGMPFKRTDESRFGGMFDFYKKKQLISWDDAPCPEYFNELFRVSERQIIWGGNFFNLPLSRGFLVWDKTNIPDKVTFASCEYAWCSWAMNAKIYHGCTPNRTSTMRFHPTQKPIDLYCWILERFAQDGEIILDTHAGSCSSLVACYQMGFQAVGVEIDEKYCEQAVRRLEKEMQQSRFDFTRQNIAREESLFA